MSEMPVPEPAGDATPETTPKTPSPKIPGDGWGRGDAPQNPPQMSEMSVPEPSPTAPAQTGCRPRPPKCVPPLGGTHGTGHPVPRNGTPA